MTVVVADVVSVADNVLVAVGDAVELPVVDTVDIMVLVAEVEPDEVCVDVCVVAVPVAVVVPV